MGINWKNRISLVLILLLAAIQGAAGIQSPSWPDSPDDKRIEFHGTLDPEAYRFFDEQGFINKLLSYLSHKRPPSMQTPMGIDFSGSLLAVADPGAGGIHVFNEKGMTRRFLRFKVNDPIDVVIADNEIIAAYSSSDKLAVFDLRGRLKRLIAPGRDGARFTGLCYTGHKLYIVNTGDHELLLYDMKSGLSEIYGGRGKELMRMNFPTFACVSENNQVYVTDSMNFRILKWSADLNSTFVIGERGLMSGQLNRPKGVACLGRNLLVVDSSFNNVQIYDEAGRFLMHFGEYGSSNWAFNNPVDAAVDGDRIFISDSENQRIQIFRYYAHEK